MYEPYIDIARSVRKEMVEKYGEFLGGKCIEASDRIVEKLSTVLGVEAVTVEGWCQYDDECYGSDRPWDEHTWVEVPSLGLYIDVTADQFNYGMDVENEYPEILVREGLPHGMRYNEPSWDEYEQFDTNKDVDVVSSLYFKICAAEGKKAEQLNNRVFSKEQER